MNKKDQLIGAWCGPAFMISLLVGWGILSGMFPPHPPTWTGEQVAAFYQANPISIRIGLVIAMLGSGLFFPFVAVIAIQMARIEGRYPVWAWVCMAAGACTVLTFEFPFVFWAVSAFRPERTTELLLALDDLAWMPFMAMSMPFLMVPISIAIAGFRDKREHPIFPRWACFANLWLALFISPGNVVILFKTGPFAWNGLFGWWSPIIAFGVWFVMTTYLLIQGINRQASEEAPRNYETSYMG